MKDHSNRFLDLVNASKGKIKENTVADVKAKLDAGDEFYLIDVREDSEWAKGHIPGSIHMGRGVIERDIEKRISDTNAEIVLYCGGGFRSALAAESLQKMGYTNVTSMDGGYGGWVKAGHG